jgi:thiamine-phosphate pyrophosphorylase
VKPTPKAGWVIGDVGPDGEAVFPARGLYAIVDTATLARRGIDPVRFAEAVLAGSPAALQVRAKDLGAAATVELVDQLIAKAWLAGVPLLLNDRPDLAFLTACDGFHVGQGDLPLDDARRVAPGMIAGVSTHNEEQLLAALALRPSYVAFGPIFGTVSKADAEPPVGLERLAWAADRAREAGIPLVAIGGIDQARAADLARLGVVGAVISALLPGQDGSSSGMREVTSMVESLQKALES